MTDPTEAANGIKAIEAMLSGISSGQWDWTNHKPERGGEIKSVEDVVELLAASARKGEGLYLHGVGAKENGEDIVVCYTGNGPKSAANALFLASAPYSMRWLIAEVARRDQAKDAEIAALRSEVERPRREGRGPQRQADEGCRGGEGSI